MNIINLWPIIVAAIVSFIIGSIWYSPFLFGRDWMILNKMSDKDISAAKAKGLWKSYVAQFIATLITFGILAFFMVEMGIQGITDGALVGVMVWVGFIATNMVSAIAWERKPIKLVLINSLGILVTLIVGGAILAAWR